MRIPILTLLFIFFTTTLFAQEITETNSDIVYTRALDEYKASNFERTLQLTKHGLELAPEYHDIRILQIRALWALDRYPEADLDLEFLLQNAPEYVDVKPIVLQRIDRFKNNNEALSFIEKTTPIYPSDIKLQIKKSLVLLKDNQRNESRKLALDLITRPGITGEDRYLLQNILNRSVTDEIGLVYQYINFSEDYSRDETWNTFSGEYQHNFNRTAVIARVSYMDRGYDNGNLYEIEAYPVFNDRFYAFTNIGVSNGNVFPNYRASASLFYNFAKILEAEVGGRLLNFNNSSYFTAILGMTAYSGKFYFNARTFIGPKSMEQLVQNYQGNIRYYFGNPDNYLFARIGSGISPDETAIFTQVQENIGLDVYYGTLGINKSIGIHHIFQVGAGMLFEDISANRSGNQFLGSISYRYRF